MTSALLFIGVGVFLNCLVERQGLRTSIQDAFVKLKDKLVAAYEARKVAKNNSKGGK